MQLLTYTLDAMKADLDTHGRYHCYCDVVVAACSFNPMHRQEPAIGGTTRALMLGLCARRVQTARDSRQISFVVCPFAMHDRLLFSAPRLLC